MKHILYLLCLSALPLGQLKGQAIAPGKDGKSWNLTTESTCYHINVSNQGKVSMSHFGSNKQDSNLLHIPLGDEVTVRGGYSTTTPVLEAVFKDGVRDIELTYEKCEITEEEGYQTLKIRQKDKYYPLAVTTYLRVLPEYNLLEKWLEVEHTGTKETIEMENIQSGTFFLPKNEYDLTHLSGAWAAEFQPSKTLLTQGIKTIQVKDFRSFGAPFFMLRPAGETMETCGEVWFGSLQYSGNWRMDFEKFATGEVQIVGGINFWDQTLTLKPGKRFQTPKFVIGYSNQGAEGVSLSLASYTREKVLYSSHRNKVRPVIYNSWYATEFDVNEAQQMALAKVAKELGVEAFVIDDGWFKGRVNDQAGLGDWTVDKIKFPNGLKPIIEQVNALGMDFGIWIEPEMVNPNSDLYRAHPDWIFHYPNRTRHQRRNQSMLNLAREDVYAYLYNSFSKLLRENNIKYVKWDMNKSLTDPGFLSAPTNEQRSVRIKYVENFYRLYRSLRQEFPEVWFENCASGGGRVDLGTMACSDFNWVSDNTDPVDRIFIQYAYLNAFPANSMISWVTHEDWHKHNHSLAFKFDVAMCGVLGVGYDITQWTKEEKTVASEKIARYKDIRETVQFGDLYRITSPYETNRSVLQFVNKNHNESVLFIYQLAEYPDNALQETRRPRRIYLRGLESEAYYLIEGKKDTYKGDALMNVGIELPTQGAYRSSVVKIKKCSI